MSKLRLALAVVALMAAVPGTSASAKTTYTTEAVTIGTKGGYPSHPNGWWRDNNAPPWWYDDFTSYCANPTNGYYYGVLTHPQGYEITPQGYGDRAYKMYDAALGWIRAANVRESDGKLHAPGRIDTCRAPGAPEGAEEPPPPPPPPPYGLAGGNDSVVGTYSCNVSRPVAGSSHVHFERDGTITVMPDRAASSAPAPLQGTWWSFKGDPEDRGGGVSLRDGVFVHFQGDTSRFTIEGDRLVISGFVCAP